MRTWQRVVSPVLGAALALALAGCGGGGGGGPLPAADVALVAAITRALGRITLVTVTATEPGDTIDIAAATARVQRADGTSAAVPMVANASDTVITLGLAAVTPSAAQFNTLVINGPVVFGDGDSGTATTIGRIEFRFEVLGDGTVVSPTNMTVRIPTRGAATDRRVVFTGLSGAAPDYARTIIRDRQGGVTQSRIYAAPANGTITVTDAQGSITADLLSGSNSRITTLFARTDADLDGTPDLME